MNDSSRRRVRLARRLSWLVVGALTVAALVPVPAFAINGSDPAPNADAAEIVAWNQGDVACLEGTGTDGAFRIEDPTDGVYDIAGTWIGTDPSDPAGVIILDVTPDDADKPASFDWAFTDTAKHNYDMAAVMVKGGPDWVVVYFYEDTTDDSDTGLIAAPNKAQPYGVSHIDFCLNRKGSPPPPPTYCVTIVKTDLGQLRLAGAVFVLKDVFGQQVGDPSPATDQDGVTTICGVVDGYSIWEVSPPPGYLIGTGAGSQVAEVPSTCSANEDSDTAYTCYFVNAPEPTPTPTPDESPTPTPTPTPPPNPTPTPTPPPNPTPTPTPVPTPTPTPVPTPTPTPVPTPPPTPEGEVAGETGTPAVTLPPTDSLVGGIQAPSGDSWRLILLAMAGILAAALLLTPAESRRRNR